MELPSKRIANNKTHLSLSGSHKQGERERGEIFGVLLKSVCILNILFKIDNLRDRFRNIHA